MAQTAGRTIILEPQEQRTVVEGYPVSENDNRPWQRMTPEGLGARSLLQPNMAAGKLIIPHGVIDICSQVTNEIASQLDWGVGFSADAPFGSPFIVDVVEQETSGQHRAIMESHFGWGRLTGHAGSGEEWKEARAVVDITPEEARLIVEKLNAKFQDMARQVMEQIEYDEALKTAGLDQGSITARREECLKKAGLDETTIRVRIAEFRSRWEAQHKK